MRPENLRTKIFLDSGDPDETREALKLMGFLDGQTTNPSLIAKKLDPEGVGKKFTEKELLKFYKDTVQEIRSLIKGSISIEVYSDENTKAEEMIEQGEEMNTWIEDAHIKLPATSEGFKAVKDLATKGINVNVTLVFTQSQAAVTYFSTIGKHHTYVSPFVGRLNDNCLDGVDLVENINEMLAYGDTHMEILAASIRDLKHMLYFISAKIDNLTAPLDVLRLWVEDGMSVPEQIFNYKSYLKDTKPECVKEIPYRFINLDFQSEVFDISSELTDAGLKKFAEDWNKLLKK